VNFADAARLDARPSRQIGDDRDLARPGDHLGISRHQYAHVDAATLERARQARGHVAEPADLGVIGELARGEENLHAG